jgi:sugar phosphate permease
VVDDRGVLPLVLAVSVAPVRMKDIAEDLGLSQTTTMDWVVNLVDDTSRGSALGLRVATNRVGQAFILAVAGVVSGAWGVQAAFVLLAVVMFATAASGVANARRGPQSAGA